MARDGGSEEAPHANAGMELSKVAVSPKSGLVGAGSLSTKRTLGDVLTHSILETTVGVKTLTEWNGCRDWPRLPGRTAEENNESTLQNQATVLVETVTVLKTLAGQRQETQETTTEIKHTSFNSQLGLTTGAQETRIVQVGKTNETPFC